MTEHKFTDEEVIRALVELKEMSEYTPPICHYQEGVTDPPFCKPFEQFQNGAKIALDLINRQRAEIERLKAGKQSIKELADELCNRIGETGITDYNTYLHVVGLIQKVMGSPCTEGADCFAAEGKE